MLFNFTFGSLGYKIDAISVIICFGLMNLKNPKDKTLELLFLNRGYKCNGNFIKFRFDLSYAKTH
jgi:hypothetical protein